MHSCIHKYTKCPDQTTIPRRNQPAGHVGIKTTMSSDQSAHANAHGPVLPHPIPANGAIPDGGHVVTMPEVAALNAIRFLKTLHEHNKVEAFIEQLNRGINTMEYALAQLELPAETTENLMGMSKLMWLRGAHENDVIEITFGLIALSFDRETIPTMIHIMKKLYAI